MKKTLFPLAFLWAGLSLPSCSQDDEIIAESPIMRDYQTDSQVLTKFVDVNYSTGKYFINEYKKRSAMSYLTNQDWLDLQKVNPINYKRYEKELEELNRLLAEYEKDPNISKIIYTTYGGKIYVKELRNDRLIQIERTENDLSMSRTAYQTFTFTQGTSSCTSFNAGATIHTNVKINTSGSYVCELKCHSQGIQDTHNNSSGLVFSGTNNTNIDYTWNSNLPSTSWEFTGTIKTLSSSSTAQITFTN